MDLLKQKIQEDLKKALKENREAEVSTLRMTIATISNRETEKRTKIWKEKPESSVKELEKESQLTDEEILEAISSEVKKRKEAILEFEKAMLLLLSRYHSAFEKGKIEDLVKKEKEELEILEKYLPEQLSEKEIKKLVKEAIEKVGAKEPKDIGKAMAELMPQVKGRADGALVSKIVKESLMK